MTPDMHPLAYEEAMQALDRQRVVTCIPGHIEGEPCVSTVSWPNDPDDDQWVYSANAGIRACYHFGVAQEARNRARQRGIVLK